MIITWKSAIHLIKFSSVDIKMLNENTQKSK